MITAKFVYSGDIITGFSVSGHSGSAEIGKDIICSAVSSASYMTVNTLTEIMLLNPEIIEKDGFLGIRLSKDEAAAVFTTLNNKITCVSILLHQLLSSACR